MVPLRDGSIDMDIGVEPDIGPEICKEILSKESFVGVVRTGNPLASRKMTMTTYAAAEHVVGSRRGLARGPIESWHPRADHDSVHRAVRLCVLESGKDARQSARDGRESRT